MSRKIKAEEETGAIDLTPMLDVVFIMLIFFIVTASFIKEPGIQVNRPDATTAALKKNANILIAINDQNEIWINKNEVDIRQVKTQIQLLLAENPKGAVVIQADKDSNIKTLTEVTQKAREAGVGDVSVSAENR
ncbi:ExbD/TolR family protein [Teredinibacter turnerae]|uniref:Transport energizing protein, ExbD/TolR family n=1 Tax=Teredinibacter turnerae (strain ATCC 39867 / T7901) TaxID=377629 RepID=C5BMA8_TERTT|nr:biopolymer transporter ExbD [Teredinibacter turnerae]ACR12506.1 transport energizing protein, ExbD/TolR family [Teredinibacter turnerae T7901]